MRLWLDAGNTRIKWQLEERDIQIASGYIMNAEDFDQALEEIKRKYFDNSKLEAIYLSSVLNQVEENSLKQSLRDMAHQEVFVAEVSKRLGGVECGYDINKLGVDRWLAVVAAYDVYKTAVCVVDCGSALTIDYVNQAGKHKGGFILPGINMSISALLGKTQSVRFDQDEGSFSLNYGKDTSEAVKGGALLSSLGAISYALGRFNSEERPMLVITGGDALLIAQNLDYPCEIIEDLVLKGLRIASLTR